MNTVPFKKLGPGQSARLTVQVLGQNGPIPNPQNIRYLPPDSPEIPSANPPHRPVPVATREFMVSVAVGLITPFLVKGVVWAADELIDLLCGKPNDEVAKPTTVAPTVKERLDQLEAYYKGLDERLDELKAVQKKFLQIGKVA